MYTIKGLCYLVSKPCIAIISERQEDNNLTRNCPGANLTEIDKEELTSFRNEGYDLYAKAAQKSTAQ